MTIVPEDFFDKKKLAKINRYNTRYFKCILLCMNLVSKNYFCRYS